MPAEAPVCARTGLVPKALDKPTAAAMAMASARDAGFRDAGFNGYILLGVLATIIWDRYQSRRHGTKPLAKLWLQQLTVNLSPVNLTPVKSKAGQRAASASASEADPQKSPRMRQHRGADAAALLSGLSGKATDARAR